MEDIFSNLDNKTKICCVSVTSLVLMLTVGMVLSFGAVEPTEYGILYNTISKKIDNTNVYEGGLQYVGLFNTLITFPSIHKTIEFSSDPDASAPELKTRTKEGLELSLHFAF
jgi:hypothetical protein